MDDLSDKEMTEIFNYTMPLDAIAHYPVFSIRGGKQQPERKGRDAYYDWGGKLLNFGQDTSAN